jgi:predicted alpha/beta hydrolase family esterase
VEKLGGPDEETVFVAHSMSNWAVCYYLSGINVKVRTAFFVSPFAEQIEIEEPYFSLVQPFVDEKVNWEKVRESCKDSICFVGDNDRFISLDVAKRFVTLSGAKELIVVPKGGHLNEESGYTTFPLLLDTIKTELTK